MTLLLTKKRVLCLLGLCLTAACYLACTKKNDTQPDVKKIQVTISSINVNSGTYNAEVIITGTGFDVTAANDKVYFNGKAATVSAATATQLTVAVPLNAGTGKITISVDGGTTVTGPSFTYVTPVTISTISANSGTYNTKVVITGTGFDVTAANDKVYFNGKAATVSAATATQLTVAVPLNAGTGKITISVDGGTTVTGPSFTYVTPVTISTISVNSGTYNTKVIITGTGFDVTAANDKVYFNGKAATVSAATATQLTVAVPLNAGTGKITISVDGGATVTGPSFTYITPVTISTISVNSGTYNTKVVITGTGFDVTAANDKVYFNGKAATVSAATATQLTVAVPLNAGTGKITISVDGGATVTGPSFTYITPVTISTISVNSGTYNTKVIITGTGFDVTAANDKVYFNGKLATVSAATATQLTVAVPLNAGTGKITLSVDGAATITGPTFTYITTATISSISISSGAYSSQVIITGTGFDVTAANDKVYFNGKLATVSAATATQLTVAVPVGAGTGNITLSVDNAKTITGPLFTYQYTGVVTTVAGDHIQGSVNSILANFYNPFGIAVDASGNLYIADSRNNRIAKLTPAGVLSVLAGTEARYPGSADGTGTAASFNIPQNLCVDAKGNVFVADTYNNLIRKITPAGVVTTIAGNGRAASVDGTGTSASIYEPFGIAVDPAGNLYVTSANLIRKITPAGVVTTLAGNSHAGVFDGTGAAAYFNGPIGIVVDAKGNLFIADDHNNAIRKVTPTGVVTTVAGAGSPNSGSNDGIGTSARFFGPYGVALDAAGNLYVADTFNNRVRMINPAGVVTTIAGKGDAADVDGVGKQASLNHPEGITVDAAGNIYVVDEGANSVRKIVLK